MHIFLKWSFALLLAGSVLLAGCGSTVPSIKPFRMDIQQGNIVTSKMLLQLRPGMTKSQVRFVMGTPLIVDSFHSNRWDYFYQMRQGGKIIEQRRVILEFEKDALLRVRGDVVPQGTAGAATGTEAGAVALPKSIEPQPKKEGFLERLKFWKKDEKKPESKPEVNQQLNPKNEPEIKPELQEVAPVVAPKTETQDAVTPETPAADSATDSTQETPSILSVPIELGPPAEQTTPTPVEQTPPTAAPVPEPVPSLPEVEPPKVAPVELPAEPEPELAVPEKPAPAQPAPKDEPFIFRMDKELDTKNIGAPPVEPPPVETPPPAQPKKADAPPPEPEAEPGYFEKMLEKIGF